MAREKCCPLIDPSVKLFILQQNLFVSAVQIDMKLTVHICGPQRMVPNVAGVGHQDIFSLVTPPEK